MTDDDTDDTRFKGADHRKKSRRKNKDRRDNMRWELENPIRRKSPGRRAIDRLLYLLDFKR
ncbi:MAG: hypothetical protein ACYDBW_08330 [Sulfuricaulis sp.]